MKIRTFNDRNLEMNLIPVNIDEIDYDSLIKENQTNYQNNNDSQSFIRNVDFNNSNLDSMNKISSTIQQIQSGLMKNSENNLPKNLKSLSETALNFDDKISYMSKYSLSNISIVTAMDCIAEVCPKTKSGGLIVNIDYKVS